MLKSFSRFMKIMGDRLPVYLIAIFVSTFGDAMRGIANSYLAKNIITAAQTGNTENTLLLVLGNFAMFVCGILIWRHAL